MIKKQQNEHLKKSGFIANLINTYSLSSELQSSNVLQNC